MPVHAIDLVLLHQLAEALDGVLGRGFLLDHQFDLAAGDAALGVVALDRPLRGADAVLAGRRGDAGARRKDADPQRLVLRDGRREDARHRQRAGSGGGFQTAYDETKPWLPSLSARIEPPLSLLLANMIYQTHVSNKHAALARAENPFC